MSNGWDDVLDFISDEWIGLHEYEDHLLDRLKQMVCPIAERDAERARAERAIPPHVEGRDRFGKVTCSCGEKYVSRCELWKHKADVYDVLVAERDQP